MHEILAFCCSTVEHCDKVSSRDEKAALEKATQNFKANKFGDNAQQYFEAMQDAQRAYDKASGKAALRAVKKYANDTLADIKGTYEKGRGAVASAAGRARDMATSAYEKGRGAVSSAAERARG